MKEKVWVGVEVYQLIVTGVHLFRNEQEAKDWFKGYTGVDWDELNDPDKLDIGLDEDYDQTKLFEEEL